MAGMVVYSANPPGRSMPTITADGHLRGRPDRQAAHRPHVVTDSAVTRSPTSKSVTSGPTSSTVPQNSWPSTRPGSG